MKSRENAQLPPSFASAIDLSGLVKKPVAEREPSVGASPYVIDVTEANFTESVMEQSKTVPVVLDFWADWCGPCKQLSPILERLAEVGAGAWLLGKIDTEAEPQLASAFQIQSIPTVIAVIDGKLLPLFQGAYPEEQISQVLTELLRVAAEQGVTGRLSETSQAPTELAEEDALDPDEAKAIEAIDRGDFDEAIGAYRNLLTRKPDDHDAKMALAQVELMQRVSNVDRSAVQSGALSNPTDVDAQIAASDLEMSDGQVEASFNRLITLVRDTSGTERQRARDHLLMLFSLVDSNDPRVTKARLALTNALF